MWYDRLYSKVSIADIVDALDGLGGKGTIRQIKKQILQMYNLQPKMLKNKGLIKDPLEILRKTGVVESNGSKYILKRYI